MLSFTADPFFSCADGDFFSSSFRAIQKQLGINGNYWASGFTRFFAISCWSMLAFALLSILLSVLALNGAPSTQHEESPTVNEKELG